jgi:hypothetical protein
VTRENRDSIYNQLGRGRCNGGIVLSKKVKQVIDVGEGTGAVEQQGHVRRDSSR